MSSVTSNRSSKVHFYDLDIWKKSTKLCVDVYKITETFPVSEKFGIIDQMRRAASLVGANIAEGFGRFHYKDKIKFYYNARGSVCEVQNFLFLAQEIKYIEKDAARNIFTEYENLNKGLNQFIKSVNMKMTDDK